jgi:HAE1 family hydrophobic/amphiphilic exporter-1
VVDDAIVMLENIMRHVENGVPPFQAALRGSREVGFTIISISLAGRGVHPDLLHARRDRPAVPRVCRGGGLAIVVSAFVSLTLVPMLASRFLTDEAHKKPPGALVRSFERGFDGLLAAYTRSLDLALRHRGWCCWWPWAPLC